MLKKYLALKSMFLLVKFLGFYWYLFFSLCDPHSFYEFTIRRFFSKFFLSLAQ